MSYEDTILIKLRRDYEKDEVVMFALNKIKELKIEAAKNESYIYEITKENSDLKAFIRKKNLEKQKQLQIPKELKKLEKENKNNSENILKQRNRILELKKTISELNHNNAELKLQHKYVYIIQDKRSFLIYGVFRHKKRAERYILGSEHFHIIKAELIQDL